MTEELKAKQDDSETQGFTVQIQWESAKDIPTIYANHLHISHAGGNEFYLVFGELGPQTDLDMNNPPECLEIKPVARIGISSPNMIRFAQAIQENVDKFKERFPMSDKENK
jgi:hypothetical protein